MREISRHTEGLSKPPTLYIHLSFFLLLLPPSCVLPFLQPTHFVFRFSSKLYAIFFSSSCLIAPISCFLSCSQVLSLFFLWPAWGLAFLCSDMYNCRVEQWDLNFERKSLSQEVGHLAAGYIIKPCRGFYVGSAHSWLWLYAVFTLLHCFRYIWMASCPVASIKLLLWHVSIKTFKLRWSEL